MHCGLSSCKPSDGLAGKNDGQMNVCRRFSTLPRADTLHHVQDLIAEDNEVVEEFKEFSCFATSSSLQHINFTIAC
jgi:hypothetical protein